ncbi:MAG: lamin tail domain-containing protein, partial [Bacteroidota bacterium]
MKTSSFFFVSIFLLFGTCFWSHSSAQVVINEGSNKNYSTIADENGDFPDWIEIFNSGTDTVSLLNYSLTDDPANPTKWTFPNVELLPGTFKVVFCSGKNRKPTSGFVQVVSETNYNATVGWNTHGFNAPFNWDGVSSLLINVNSYAIGYTTNSVFNQTATAYNSTIFAFQDGSPAVLESEYGFKVPVRPNLKLNGVAVGTGTQQNSPFDYPAPYGNWYWAAKNQMVVPASELLAAGLAPGPITSIGFDVVSTDPSTVYQNMDIAIKQVSYTEVSSIFEPVDTSLRLHTNFKFPRLGETVYLYDDNQSLISSLLVNPEQQDVSTGLFTNANTSAGPVLFAVPTPGSTNNMSPTY